MRRSEPKVLVWQVNGLVDDSAAPLPRRPIFGRSADAAGVWGNNSASGGWSSGARERITARSMKCSSSRTLPGHTQTLAHGPVVIHDKDAWVVLRHGCTS